MKKWLTAGCLLVAAVGFAAEFPYATEMTVRNEKASAEVSSFENPVEIPAVDGGMPATDSVATLYAAVVDFCASDDENWLAATTAVNNVQAALTLKIADGVCVWMGYTDGEWKEFAADGAVAEEGEWAVKVDVDYSVEPTLIRYSVRKTDAADYVALLCGGNAWVPTGRASGEQVVGRVLLYGSGETGLVQAKSGCRKASGTIAVATDFGRKYQDLKLDISVTDPWGVDSVEVELKDAEGRSLGTQTAALVGGVAQVAFGGVTPCETYTYDLTLRGERRGADISFADEPKEVLVGVQADWFAFEDGVFTNATAGAGLTVADDVLSAAAVSPRGLVVPTAAARDAKVVTVESTLAVAGAVQEGALADLDAADTQGALTVVRFSDGERGWACRLADGTWARLSGAGVAATNGTYEVRMDLDYRKDTRGVSYSVKAADGWVRLADANGRTRFDLPAGAAVIARASLLGGTVSRLSAACKSTPKVFTGFMVIVK